jgi:UPF0716 family protein affecting phage T7 exclusion
MSAAFAIVGAIILTVTGFWVLQRTQHGPPRSRRKGE